MADTMTRTLRTALTHIGLSEKSAAIYLGLLSLGEATASEIAKRSGLKRTTVYNIIPELLAQGAIRTALRRGRRVYFVEDTRHLREAFEHKLALVDGLLPELAKLHRVLGNRTKVFAFEGERGVRDFFLDTIRHTNRGETIREIVGPHAFYSSLPQDLIASYVPQRVKKGIHIRIIASRSAISSQLAQRAGSELRQIRFTAHEAPGFRAASLIYGNRVGYISLQDDFAGVSLESETIAAMQRDIFDALWEKLPSR